MATIIGDIMCPTGKYTTQDGQEKNRWLKCGIMLQTDNGFRIKMEAMPVGVADFEGWFSVFDKKNDQPNQKASGGQAQQQGFRNAPAEESDVPF